MAVGLGGTLVLAGCGADGPTAASVGTPEPGSAPATAPAATDPPITIPVPTAPIAPTTVSTAAPPPAPPAAPAPAAVRGLPVVRSTVTLVDPSRPTVSRGRRVAPTRTLTTTVVAPATGGPWPLVLFAHGFQLGPPGYAHLIETLAAAGYVVAAPSFPLADAEVGGAAIDRGDIPNQSADLRFVADRLTAGPDRDPRVDATRIGAVGHSDGADTVLDLGYHRDRRDARMRAVAALSSDAVPLPPGGGPPPPLLLTHGSADRTTPYAESTALFARVTTRRWLLTLTGADHLPPVQGAGPWALPLERAVLALLDTEVAGRSVPPGATLADAAVPAVADLRSAG
jgi:dienelactone hydrolase